jgi:hypothetical protein
MRTLQKTQILKRKSGEDAVYLGKAAAMAIHGIKRKQTGLTTEQTRSAALKPH